MTSVFPQVEFEGRLEKVRQRMDERGLDACLVSTPESIYYLTGLDHWGFFAAHILIVPRCGIMILVARAMERVTVENQVANAKFLGHADGDNPADYVLKGLNELALLDGKLGLEKDSLFLTPGIAEAVVNGTPNADWQDTSGLVAGLRLVQSPLEMEYTRKAAQTADSGMLAAIEAIQDGASDYEVAAECSRAIILAGSEYPGFGPFIRPKSRLNEEHTTWRGDTFQHGDAVFLELAGAFRKYHAPMGRLVYIGKAPGGAEKSADLAIRAMQAICDAIQPGAKAGDAYAAWREVARAHGLIGYERHHCGYLVGIGFPPSWTGGSMVTSLAPDSQLELKVGMAFHAHAWFTNTDCVDYFISNTVLLGENGCEVLTKQTPKTLIVR